LIIDDPVQAMDPSKVDGLAQVFSDAALDRQVIVFTHDARLPEALVRLNLPATVIEVVRSENSEIQLRTSGDPVAGNLELARDVARSGLAEPDSVGPKVAGFARKALVAACEEKVRRIASAAGTGADDIDSLLATSATLHEHMSLALFGDPDQGPKVYEQLNKISRNHTDDYRRCLEDANPDAFAGWADSDFADFISSIADIAATVR